MSGGDWKEMDAAAESGDLQLVACYLKLSIDIDYFSDGTSALTG
jgi:hypothetical protein